MPAAISTLGVALVTGASKGIGRAIALRLAKDGFDVAINDLPVAEESLDGVRKEIAALGRRPFVAIGDVSVEKNVKNMVSSVAENLGQLNVMVANAGICKSTPIIETEVSQWEKLLAVNTIGLFLSYKYAALQMIKQGKGGRIIGASSVAGKRGEIYMGTYSATKFAVRGLTQVAAKEWAQHGITVNSYCPGIIQTDILKDLYGADKDLPGLLQLFRDTCPVGDNGTPEEVAGLVSYLASKEARFVTGQGYIIDGGRECS